MKYFLVLSLILCGCATDPLYQIVKERNNITKNEFNELTPKEKRYFAGRDLCIDWVLESTTIPIVYKGVPQGEWTKETIRRLDLCWGRDGVFSDDSFWDKIKKEPLLPQ